MFCLLISIRFKYFKWKSLQLCNPITKHNFEEKLNSFPCKYRQVLKALLTQWCWILSPTVSIRTLCSQNSFKRPFSLHRLIWWFGGMWIWANRRRRCLMSGGQPAPRRSSSSLLMWGREGRRTGRAFAGEKIAIWTGK